VGGQWSRGIDSSKSARFPCGIVDCFSAFSDEFMPSGSHIVKVERNVDHFFWGKKKQFFVYELFHLKKMRGKFVQISNLHYIFRK
jgi:hypothetical protein